MQKIRKSWEDSLWIVSSGNAVFERRDSETVGGEEI